MRKILAILLTVVALGLCRYGSSFAGRDSLVGDVAPTESILLAKKLKGAPDDFIGKQIRLQCGFYEISSNVKAMSAPIYYDVGLSIYVRTSDHELTGIIFMNVSVIKQKSDIVYSLDRYEPITIYAKVLASNYPTGIWIRVYDIKKGWK